MKASCQLLSQGSRYAGTKVSNRLQDSLNLNPSSTFDAIFHPLNLPVELCRPNMQNCPCHPFLKRAKGISNLKTCQ